jgi:predicted RNA-binding protein YlxR (DUF448 family)
MAKKPVKRVKHVPQRTCVGCRETLPKRTLIRVVRTGSGVKIDLTGKMAGRGAYLHNKRSCWERGLKGALAHALKADLTSEETETLKNFLATLPEEAPEAALTASSAELKEVQHD